MSAGEQQPIVLPEELELWEQQRERAVREAGSRGTWDGRRDVRGRHDHLNSSAEAEGIPDFRGKYVGKCAVNMNDLEEAGLVQQPLVD